MPRRHPLVWALIGLFVIELIGVAVLAVVATLDLLTASASSPAGGIALVVLVWIAVAALAAIVVGAIRGQAWIRAAAIVWQILQLVIGIGALQGVFAQAAWGWPLIVLAVAGLVLLFVPVVVASTSDRVTGQD